MIRAVLDANVLASGFPAQHTTPAEVINRWMLAEFELVTSKHVLDATARAWNKPYYRARYSRDQAQQTLDVLRATASIVLPADTVHGVADDDEADLVLATAVAAKAPYLVTGDHGLQRLRTYAGIRILSPREFLDLLRQESNPDE